MKIYPVSLFLFLSSLKSWCFFCPFGVATIFFVVVNPNFYFYAPIFLLFIINNPFLNFCWRVFHLIFEFHLPQQHFRVWFDSILSWELKVWFVWFVEKMHFIDGCCTILQSILVFIYAIYAIQQRDVFSKLFQNDRRSYK